MSNKSKGMGSQAQEPKLKRILDYEKLRQFIANEAELARSEKTEAIMSQNKAKAQQCVGRLEEIDRIAKALDWRKFDIDSPSKLFLILGEYYEKKGFSLELIKNKEQKQ
jgi:hypothetical protein